MNEHDDGPSYVSRGGLKLRHALDAFALDPTGLWCADLGCSTGGFTDCLVQAGAARVYAVDTAYGELAWSLRQDERVVVMERTNALHAEPPADVRTRGGVDLVVIDLGWTTQDRALPVAERWLNQTGRIITLIKPHYERAAEIRAERGGRGAMPRVVLDDAEAETVAERVRDGLPQLGFAVHSWTCSPLRGGARSKGGKGTGNLEWLALVEPR